MKFLRVFTVRIIYKCGYVHDFECIKFKVTTSPNRVDVSWTNADPHHNPMMMGLDDVAAIWQISNRWKFYWKAPKEIA